MTFSYTFLAPYSLINTGEDYPWYGTQANEGAFGWGYQYLKRSVTWGGRVTDGYDYYAWCVESYIEPRKTSPNGHTMSVRLSSNAAYQSQ